MAATTRHSCHEDIFEEGSRQRTHATGGGDEADRGGESLGLGGKAGGESYMLLVQWYMFETRLGAGSPPPHALPAWLTRELFSTAASVELEPRG